MSSVDTPSIGPRTAAELDEFRNLYASLDRRSKEVWKNMLRGTFANMVLWVVWWLYGRDVTATLAVNEAGSIYFWLIFTGLVWALVLGAIVEYWKLERKKKAVAKILFHHDG